MKILILTQYFWPEDFRINDLATGLVEMGHEIEVLTGMPNYPGGKLFTGYRTFKPLREKYEGIPIVRVPLIPREKGRGWQLILNYLSFAFSGSLIGPFLCRGKYDFILVYEPSPITVGLPAIVMKAVKRAPVLFWVQDLWPESLSATGSVNSKTLLKIVKSLVRFIYRQCDQILIQSKAFSSSVESFGVIPKRILYYPNSAENFYRPMNLAPDAHECFGIPAGFRVMFAGNIGVAQDFPTILKAAEYLKEYHDIHFIILGDGRMHSWVAFQVRERGLTDNVHLLGRYPVETMPRYFSLADVLLVTLRKEPIFELTIPSKIQSYLACAKPIIAALDGEGARIIEEAGAGLTCPSENPGALAKAVLTLYNMPQSERQVMGKRGRTYFNSHFEHKMLLDQLETWMKELIEDK